MQSEFTQLERLRREFRVDANSARRAKTQQLVQDLDKGLIHKFEDLKLKVRTRDNLAHFKRVLGKTVEFLEKAVQLKKARKRPDLRQLSRCRDLARDEDLGTVGAVQKEAHRVNSLHSEHVRQHSQSLRKALEAAAHANVLE